MPTDDPEGTETRSDKERADNLDVIIHDLLGKAAGSNKNPEGVPEGDRGSGKKKR